MANGRRLLAAISASIALAAPGIPAAPAAAQTGGGGGNYGYNCNDPTSGGYGGGYGHGCCQYDPYWGGWYIMYATHWEPCTPPYYSREPADPASQESSEPAGQ